MRSFTNLVHGVPYRERFFIERLTITGDLFLIPASYRHEWQAFDVAAEESAVAWPVSGVGLPDIRDVAHRVRVSAGGYVMARWNDDIDAAPADEPVIVLAFSYNGARPKSARPSTEVAFGGGRTERRSTSSKAASAPDRMHG